MNLISLFTKKRRPVIIPSGKHGLSRANVEPEVLNIMNRLRRNGFDACLVGGCVRDQLLGKKPKDFDIVTDARPRQIKKLFRRCFLIGKRFRLAHVYIGPDRFVEVATYRAIADPEQVQGGRWAANNVYGSIEDDAFRRDFTVNALYFNSADSSIRDYCGGLRDLKKKILRSIGDPYLRFREDPVRIIRAARFCAQLGFKPSAKDEKASRACAPLITGANQHRLLEELLKILRSGSSAGTFVNLESFGILSHWLPDLEMDRHRGRLLRRLAALDRLRNEGRELSNGLLLAVLLFDIIEEAVSSSNRQSGFHEAFVAIRETCAPVQARLKISRRDWDDMCQAAARRWYFLKPPSKEKKDKSRRRSEARFIQGPLFSDAITLFGILSEAYGEHRDIYEAWIRKSEERRVQAARRGENEAHHPTRQADENRSLLNRPSGRKRKRRRKKSSTVQAAAANDGSQPQKD